MDIKKLIEYKIEFIKELKKLEKECVNESDFDELVYAVEDILNSTPHTLLHTDYIPRSICRSYLNDGESIQFVNNFMEQLYLDDVFHLDDDKLCDDIEYAKNEFYKAYGETK